MSKAHSYSGLAITGSTSGYFAFFEPLALSVRFLLAGPCVSATICGDATLGCALVVVFWVAFGIGIILFRF
jgi:hypothetical protein